MNESILIQKIIQIGVNLNSGELEYSGAKADAKHLLDDIKQQCNIDSVIKCTHCYGTGKDHGDESMKTDCLSCK